MVTFVICKVNEHANVCKIYTFVEFVGGNLPLKITFMTFGDRLTILIKRLGFKNVTSFEDKVGVSRKTFSKVIKEGTDTGCKNILKIWDNFPEVNIHWLLTGSGEMLMVSTEKNKSYIEPSKSSYLAESPPSYDKDEYIQTLRDQIDLLKVENDNKQNIIEMFKRGEIVVTPRNN